MFITVLTSVIKLSGCADRGYSLIATTSPVLLSIAL